MDMTKVRHICLSVGVCLMVGCGILTVGDLHNRSVAQGLAAVRRDVRGGRRPRRPDQSQAVGDMEAVLTGDDVDGSLIVFGIVTVWTGSFAVACWANDWRYGDRWP